MEREVRYCTTSDGVTIAYQVEGDGPPVVAGAQLFESFSVGHLIPRWEAIFEASLQGRSIVRYDPRGIGLSQRDVDDVTVEAGYRDLAAVVHASGFKAPSLLCSGLNVPPAVLFAARHPDRKMARVMSEGSEARL